MKAVREDFTVRGGPRQVLSSFTVIVCLASGCGVRHEDLGDTALTSDLKTELPVLPNSSSVAPEADAFVDSHDPDATFGTAGSLEVLNSDELGAREAFLRFRVGPVAPYSRAQLRLYVSKASHDGFSVSG